jgi:hypothetical protein
MSIESRTKSKNQKRGGKKNELVVVVVAALVFASSKRRPKRTNTRAYLVEQPFPVLDAAKRVDQRARQLAPSIGKVVLHVREVRLPIERRDGCVSRTVLSSVPMFRRLEARRLFLHFGLLLLLLFNGC